ncbi:hypothetical protein [Amycolatopsis sp. cmx-11-51]|uniref:hypothetical protein n=1 Tax=Amycolatopsis sp. cmx-11-51 TaxID=2785797 RepID=UPI0039E3A710
MDTTTRDDAVLQVKGTTVFGPPDMSGDQTADHHLGCDVPAGVGRRCETRARSLGFLKASGWMGR